MTQMITDIEARDRIIAAVTSAKPRDVFASDWTKARYLANGELIRGIKGGFANSIVFSPAGARSPVNFDRLFFYNANGVLAHEEPARSDVVAKLMGPSNA